MRQRTNTPLAEAIGAFHERLQRIRSHQRIDGEAVGFEVAAAAGRGGSQIGPGIGCGRSADIAAFGVENDADARSLSFLDPARKRGEARQPARFKISRLEFDEADAALDRFDHETDKAVDPRGVMAEKFGNVGLRRIDAGDEVAKSGDVCFDQFNP